MYIYTVPTLNSCTKCVGSRDKIDDRTPDCHPSSGHGCMDDLTTERSLDFPSYLGHWYTWLIS